jgi:hypothetical protein
MAPTKEQRIEEAANAVIAAFKEPETLPNKLADIVLNVGRWSSKWSWSNQIIVAFMGYSDAMTMSGWKKHAGRRVIDGQERKGFNILRPVKKWITTEDEDTGEKVSMQITVGFAPHYVFGLEQTEVVNEKKWNAFAGDAQEHISTLPWINVALDWGITVDGGTVPGAKGHFDHRGMIGLGVKNLSVWAHELAHASEKSRDRLTIAPGQQPDNEIVAELSAAILLTVAGMEHEADLGGAWDYIKHYGGDNPMQEIEKLLGRTKATVEHILSEADRLEEAA